MLRTAAKNFSMSFLTSFKTRTVFPAIISFDGRVWQVAARHAHEAKPPKRFPVELDQLGSDSSGLRALQWFGIGVSVFKRTREFQAAGCSVASTAAARSIKVAAPPARSIFSRALLVK